MLRLGLVRRPKRPAIPLEGESQEILPNANLVKQVTIGEEVCALILIIVLEANP